MKAGLIIKLVEAHCSGAEQGFENALLELVRDEETKGNVSLATSLKRAYEVGIGTHPRPSEDGPSSVSYDTQGIQAMVAPKDKESLLELFEIICPEVHLDDVMLPRQQKNALKQIISEQQCGDRLIEAGITAANRLLLCGPPGCGKTMTAMALATELRTPIAYVRLDGLVSSYLGQTSTNLRRVFDSVRNRRIILFLDEFDAIAKKRDDAHELGELKRVVTTLLQNFDNMPPHVFLIAATNHEHLLDPAIWRRFNSVIVIGLPELPERQELLAKCIADYRVRWDVDINLIAQVTEGLNCAQIRELVLATAKRALISESKDGRICTEMIIETLLQQLTMYSKDDSDRYWSVVRTLKDNGVTVRVLEEATGIPRSTLSYRLNKGADND